MLPSADFYLPIAALTISNRHIDDFLVKSGRPEQKVKITEGVEVPEIIAVGSNSVIILSPQNLGPAQPDCQNSKAAKTQNRRSQKESFKDGTAKNKKVYEVSRKSLKKPAISQH